MNYGEQRERWVIGRHHGQVSITALFVGLDMSQSGQNCTYIKIEIYMTASSTLRKAEGDQLIQMCYMAKPLHPPDAG